MNSAIAPHKTIPESESQRFEFGYEKKSKDSRSVQRTRADFLTIVLDKRPNVVLDLFTRTHQPFIELLLSNATSIDHLSRAIQEEIPETAYSLREPKYIRRLSLRKFMPNWNTAQRLPGSQALCDALIDWARRNNLSDEWLLDDALAFLRAWDIADYKKRAMDCLPNTRLLFDVIRNCWRSAVRDRHFCGVSNQFQSNTEVEERGAFLFNFKYEHLEFSVIGPFSKSVPEFKREVEKEFEARGGRSVRGARKSLRCELDKYLIEVDRVSSALGLKAPSARWSTANHLSWLTQYQLVPCKTYRQIAREVEKDDKTVSEGIQRAAALIGLTLRSSEADKRSGRPKGARDKKPRHRAESGREKLRGN